MSKITTDMSKRAKQNIVNRRESLKKQLEAFKNKKTKKK